MPARLLSEIARGLQAPVQLQTWGVLMLAAALVLAGAVLARLSCRSRMAEAARGLAILATHNEQAALWLQAHHTTYADWYEGRRRRLEPVDTPTVTLPRFVDETEPVAAPDPVPEAEVDEHAVAAGWVGPPGECGARCACGTTFAGFDSPDEAMRLLDRHIPDAPEPPAVEHYHTGGWVGPPGTCAAECACGTAFDGFDTLGEACQHLERHIADATAPEPVPAAVR